LSETVISIRQLSKKYQLGEISRKNLSEDIENIWARLLRKNIYDEKVISSKNVKLNNVSESIWALKDINLNIERGEIIGIIGKNGAGKSTLLKILSKITSPTYGEIKINGRIASLLEVGTGFHPELTGKENIYLNGAILGMTKQEITSKLDEIIDFSGVENYIETPVKRFSSGMRVRLAFSVAAHLDPEILLIDEVLAVGDIEFQEKCLSKIDSISGSGRTILFVSHNMSAVQELCARSILLSSGEILMDDKTDKVINDYFSRNSKITGERKFDNEAGSEKNEIVDLRLFRVTNNQGETCSSFNVRDNISLEIEFIIHSDLYFLSVSFYVYNNKGVLIFTTGNNYFFNEKKLKKAGYYRSKCFIPRDLLNDGQYSLECNFTGKKEIYIMEKNAIFINIADSKDINGARGLYHESKWPPASVRPKLVWENEYIEKNHLLNES